MRTVTLERVYAAPPEKVYSAWTDVSLLTQWFGCEPNVLWDVHAWDPKPGGAIHVSLDFDGSLYEVRGQFEVVDPPNALRYAWEHDQVVSVTFEPVEKGTRMVLVHSGLPNEDMEKIVTGGWTSAVEQIRKAWT